MKAQWARLALAAVFLVALFHVACSPAATSLTHALTRDVVQSLRRPPAGASPVVLVAVESGDLASPLPPGAPVDERRVLALAVDRAHALGARVIVLAPLLDRPGEPVADGLLEESIRRAGCVVLAEETPYSWWMPAGRVLGPAPRFAAAARGAGLATPALDLDGMVRRIVLSTQGDAGAHVHIGRLVEQLLSGGKLSVEAMPRDRYGAVLYDAAAVPPVPRFALARLLGPSFESLRAALEGRVVVLGQPDPGAVMFFPCTAASPLADPTFATADELTALAVSCVLARAALVDLGPALGYASIIALVLMAALFFRLDRLRFIAALALALVALVWGAAYALAQRGALLDAWLFTRGLAVIAVARAADLWIVRRARLVRLQGLMADQSRRAMDPTHVPGSGSGLDARLLAELLPARYADPVPIGQGGMGLVCRVHDRTRGVDVALKLLTPTALLGARAFERFLAEVRLLQALQHPGLVRVLDVQLDGIPFFTMELLAGTSLDHRLKEKGPLAPLAAVLLVREIAEVLAFMHGKGVTHRDVKPSNVMVLADGTIKLLDLGVAREAGAGLTATGDVVGTLTYMPPEQLVGSHPGPACDVYSCGVLLAECLTGAVPVRDGVTHVVAADALAARGASPALAALIARLLDPRPSQRPADGAALIAALDAVAPTVEDA